MRVLIHSAAGGVGLSSIQICKALQLEIFGTCSTEQKLELLKTHGVNHPVGQNSNVLNKKKNLISKITQRTNPYIFVD
jgi:NADPH:quinone reductase-like Zn-dependent oxidoreductase